MGPNEPVPNMLASVSLRAVFDTSKLFPGATGGKTQRICSTLLPNVVTPSVPPKLKPSCSSACFETSANFTLSITCCPPEISSKSTSLFPALYGAAICSACDAVCRSRTCGQRDGAVGILDVDFGLGEQSHQLFLQSSQRGGHVDLDDLRVVILIPDNQLGGTGLLGGDQQIVGPERDHVGNVRQNDVDLLDPLIEVAFGGLARFDVNDLRGGRLIGCADTKRSGGRLGCAGVADGHANVHSAIAVPIASAVFRPILNSCLLDMIFFLARFTFRSIPWETRFPFGRG